MYCSKRTTGHGITHENGRDTGGMMKFSDDNCPAEIMDAEDPLIYFIYFRIYRKTKKVYNILAVDIWSYTLYSFKMYSNMKENDVYWCTADIGWITGHSYIVYGPLLNGATTLMFEGVPTYPDAGRFWDVVDKHQVNIFYTAPTAIRALQAFGLIIVDRYNLKSL